MTHESNPVPSVAIIGTEGAGKTVLTAVLAKRLGNPESGMFLNAQGPKTLKHVEKVWSILQNGDWPEGNPAGELFQLRWKLEIDGYYVSDVRFVEAAGQDFRALFEGEQFDNASTRELRMLADYCTNSDIVIFLVNLSDFIGKKQSELRASNEAAIKAAMDTLSQGGKTRRFCIVVTQSDLFYDEAERLGGWENVIRTHLGNLYGAYVHSNRSSVFPVSAVRDTVVREDAYGAMIRVPQSGFSSEGLENLIAWLKVNIEAIAAANQVEEQQRQEQEYLTQGYGVQADRETIQNAPSKLAWRSIVFPIVSLILCLFVLPQTCSKIDKVSLRPQTLWESIWGTPAPTKDVISYDTETIIIITLVVAVIAFVIGRAIDKEKS